ncbi:MAG: PKD domain-containing protein [Ferruginibacter sp.]
MKHNCKKIYLALIFLAFCGKGLAQNLSNKGTDFWVGYGHHQFMEATFTNTQEMVIYLSAELTANVTVKIEGTAWVQNYLVPAGNVIATAYIPKAGAIDARLISLPCSFVPPGTPCGGEGVFSNKGIHITSDVPIVAYAHIFGSASSGATMLMPVETWGYSYITLNSKQSYGQDGCFSWAYAIAQHDNTVIEITPTAVTRSFKPANTPFTVTLNRGQIYQLMAGPEGPGAKPDLSGTRVKSIANATGECYPIAVFAGSSRTANPASCGSGGGDNDNQQCFPSQAWGKRYLTAPTSNSTTASTFMTNTYKIAVKDPTTIVKRNGVQIPLGTLINNTYYTFESSTADYIEADKPIMVAQFMTGGACMGGGVGDPEMMYISPLEQGIKRIGFYRNNREAITVNYLTLIIPTTGVSSLTVDGSSAFSYTYIHPNLPGYTVVIKRWTSAQAQAIAQSDSAFTAITYGLGSVESYGYNAGTLINNLSALGSIYNTSATGSGVTEHPFTCTKTPVQLSVLLGYPTPPTKIVWQLSLVGGGLSPNTDVIDNSPTPVGSQLVNGVTYYKYTLPGNYTFTTAGTYRIPILGTHPSIEGCNNTESLYYDIEVRGRPLADFSFVHSGCVLDPVNFNGESISSNGFSINQWLWTFPDATTATVQNTVKLFATPGTKAVNIRVVSTEGCVSDTTKNVDISDKPIVNFTTIPAAVCSGTAIQFNDASTYTGTTPFSISYWNFGDPGSGANNTSALVNPTHTFSTYGTFNVKHTAGLGVSCVGDTVTKVVRVYAPPTTSFTMPAGCLPATGIVQFTSTASTPDGQAITGHAWNFGDPGSGVNNISALPNPTHAYPTFGNYTITYGVTTANGCFKDTIVNASFNLSPTFSYPVLPAVCQNTSGTISVASATVTNAVPGSGVYHGPATDLAGNFNPSLAGAGTHTIWYVYTTTANCKDSVSQTINVKPTPNASFAIPAAACLPTSGIVSFSYTGTAIAGQTYAWNFGDPGSGVNNTSTIANPSHNYSTGTYTITLSITANGCTKDSIVTNTFNVTPALAYPALPSVCESISGTVSVATASVTNGATGSGVYSGTAVDGAGNFNPSLAGPGIHIITYTFTGTGNCIATKTQTITVYAKPAASFTFPSVACLPTTGLVQFTYNGSLSAGQTYSWNFGDPASGVNNTSTLQNPTHVYSNTGNHAITVTVTNTNTCVDDSVINAVFSVTPALAYPALASVCQSVSGTVSVATATVTNGVSGAGVYSGPGVDAAGNFNPSLAGPGIHTITYTFTSTAGCIGTKTQTITVFAKPAASFTFPSVACLPITGLVQFTYNGSVTAGQTYAWNFGDPASGANNTSTLQNPTHIFSNTGNHAITVTVTNANTCVDDSIINAVFSVTPALAYPALTSLCQSVTGTVSVATATVTNGVSGTGVYSGPGVDAAGNFSPSLAGPGTHTITYTFTSTGGCVATRTQTITVYAKPASSFTFPSVACLPTTGLVQFTYNGTVTAGQTYLWDFGDPASGANNSSTIQNPTHIYSNTGNHAVIVTVTNPNGCVDDSVINAIFSVTPALAYPALTALCQSVIGTASVATATVTNGVSGTGVYSGPGVDAAGNFSPSLAGAGTHTITYTFTSTGGCVATRTQTITVYAKPASSFTFPAAACLPTNGLVQFTYNGSLTVGQTYLWNFGDPVSGVNNTSTLQNPAHNYTNTGNHAVSVTVTNPNGCVDDSARSAIFSVTPALAYPTLSALCQSVPGTVSIATATVTNNVEGTGVYSGPGVDASGNFNPSLAGPGTHTITYTFTSTGGCVATKTQTVKVNPKPVSVFSINNSICLGQQAQITDNSTIPAGSSIVTWKWFFGDATTATNNNNNPFTKLYLTHGTYTVKLVTVSADGCTSDTATKTIIVNAVPVSGFKMPASVCMPNGTATFVNTSTVADGTALTYVWDFGDLSAGSTAINPSHVYAAIGSYNIKLRATSTSGCFKDSIQTFSAFFDKPNALFTVSPDKLCQGADNIFTDQSSAPNSTIKTRLWIFGDGTTSSTTNPTKRYTKPGVYEVKLVVTNNENCISDTFRRIVTVYLQPMVDAGPSFVVMQGTVIQFKPTVNDSATVNFLWTPPFGLSSATALRPKLTANTDQVYTLTATGDGNCSASDILTVKILRPVKIPNAFSPNGDGINDTWVLDNLIDYPGATVEVYNRYGQLVFNSIGYGTTWDGTIKGKPLPVATYYYIIKLENGFQPLTGPITIIR